MSEQEQRQRPNRPETKIKRINTRIGSNYELSTITVHLDYWNQDDYDEATVKFRARDDVAELRSLETSYPRVYFPDGIAPLFEAVEAVEEAELVDFVRPVHESIAQAANIVYDDE